MKSRLVFVDLLRGWAALVMIEVHVFNAFLLNSIKGQPWFDALNYVNGLVAPSFLFIAGFVFVLTSERKIDEFRKFGDAFWKQLQRIALVWCIGYGLHLPFFSFIRILKETDEHGWLAFYQADVLHCIALGLLVLFILRILASDLQRYRRTLSWLTAALILSAPFLWEVDFLRFLPAPFAAYLNGAHISQFPIFNWMGFLTCGGLFAGWFVDARKEGREFVFFRSLTYLGVGLIVGGKLLRSIPVLIPVASDAIRANPLFFAERLGIILVLLALCWWYADLRKTERSFVIDASKESLLVYAGHLMVIYGQFSGDQSLFSLYGNRYELLPVIGATLGLIAVSVAAAKAWNWFKTTYPDRSRLAAYTFFSVIVLLFIIRPH